MVKWCFSPNYSWGLWLPGTQQGIPPEPWALLLKSHVQMMCFFKLHIEACNSLRLPGTTQGIPPEPWALLLKSQVLMVFFSKLHVEACDSLKLPGTTQGIPPDPWTSLEKSHGVMMFLDPNYMARIRRGPRVTQKEDPDPTSRKNILYYNFGQQILHEKFNCWGT